MNLRHLYMFKTVAEEGSMSKAGKILYMSQPAVSQTILELEETLNVKLFERLNKKLVLTNPGEILYSYAKRILLLVNEAENSMKDISNATKGKLTLGASTTIGIYLVPKIVGHFIQQYPRIDINYMIDNTRIIEQMILDHKIDIGLVEGTSYSKEIAVHHFLDDELHLTCSPEHSWIKAGQLSVEPEEISSQSLILREKGSGTRQVVEKAMSDHGLTYHTSHVLNNTEAIKKAVEANIGVAFFSEMSINEEISLHKLYTVKIKGVNITRQFNIIYHTDKYKSPVFNTFLNHIAKYKNTDT
ncbi:MAG: selenium metabolism-associated LysR family transcriptional regulator [Bacillota bacterium]